MKTIQLLLISFSILLSTCKKEEKLVTYKVDGYAQKGPFLTGATVLILELDSKLNQTGRTFTSIVEDNTGKFSFPNVQFASSYVQIKVTGQAYNEILGDYTLDELTLYSIADLSSTAKINVNIMTNMVEARLKTLVDAGSSYKDAKTQAETELLKTFSLDSLKLTSSETYNLTENSTQGGVLLLLSAIIQSNFGTNMSFQEYVTNLQTDFKTDGVINSEILTKSLAISASYLDVDQIFFNLKNRYNELGLTFTPFDIKPLLKKFINSTKYSSIYENLFPATVNGAINLISNQDTIIINKSLPYVIAINSTSNNAFYSMGVFITSNDNGFTTSNVNFYHDLNTQKLYKNMTDNTNLVIPISFSGSGQLTLQIQMEINEIVGYKTKTYIVIWK